MSDECTHFNGRYSTFKDGICEDCGYKCDHDGEIDEGICLDCGEFVPPEVGPDWMDLAHEYKENYGA